MGDDSCVNDSMGYRADCIGICEMKIFIDKNIHTVINIVLIAALIYCVYIVYTYICDYNVVAVVN